MAHPKPCPFCGQAPTILTEKDGVIGGPVLLHKGSNVGGHRQTICPLGHWAGPVEMWNKRK